MTKKRVAIAGAGLVGLSAATALAQRGFEVTIYERAEEAREFGAGIYLKENSLPVLDKFGVTDRIADKGVFIKAIRVVDRGERVVVRREMRNERLLCLRRPVLHEALLDAATEAGARLVTGKKVVKATPDGTLHFEDGATVDADVVIGADGINSNVRDSLGLLKKRKDLGDTATRLIIDNVTEPYGAEYWSGQHRVGVNPCSATETYLYLVGPARYPRVSTLPLDREYWSELFPELAYLFEKVTDDAGVHHRLSVLTCHSWVSGRVAIMGDAAHAQPPNFGQGAGVGIAASWDLASILAKNSDTASALQEWEALHRPRISRVQQLSTLYDYAAYGWPVPLSRARAGMFKMISKTPYTAKRWELYWRGGAKHPQIAEPLA